MGEDLKDAFERALPSTTPLLAADTDAIVAAGRRRARLRTGFAAGGSLVAAVLAVGLLVNVSSGGLGPGTDPAASPGESESSAPPVEDPKARELYEAMAGSWESLMPGYTLRHEHEDLGGVALWPNDDPDDVYFGSAVAQPPDGRPEVGLYYRVTPPSSEDSYGPWMECPDFSDDTADYGDGTTSTTETGCTDGSGPNGEVVHVQRDTETFNRTPPNQHKLPVHIILSVAVERADGSYVLLEAQVWMPNPGEVWSDEVREALDPEPAVTADQLTALALAVPVV